MQLELKDEKGVIGTIELTDEKLAELKGVLGLGSASTEAKAELQGRKSLVDQVSEWVDTQVIAEMVIDHLKSEGLPRTLEEAKAVWLDTLEMLGSHLAEGGKLHEGKTMGDFTPTEKAEFVIAWAKGLSLEDKAVFAEAVGLPIAKATEAEVAEAEEAKKPQIVKGKTTETGYKFLEHLNLSIRES